ncbi:MAG: hypothetical protein AAGI46_09975, partial [Planctomycetota bacterium]
PTLWSKGYFEVLIKESPEDSGRFFNGEINVQHMKPDRLRVKAEKNAFGDVFDLGTDGQQLFLRFPIDNVAYVGTADRLDPRKIAGLPIRPDLILQVLAINLLPTDLTQFPAPTLRYDPESDLHRVAFVELARFGPRRLVVTKEVWYSVPEGDDATPLARRVILNDEAGRPVLVATLARHQRVEEDGPLVATRLLLFFPQTGGKMRMDLEELLYERGRRGRKSPNERTFVVDPDRTGEDVFDLDLPPPNAP